MQCVPLLRYAGGAGQHALAYLKAFAVSRMHFETIPEVRAACRVFVCAAELCESMLEFQHPFRVQVCGPVRVPSQLGGLKPVTRGLGTIPDYRSSQSKQP